MRGKVVAQAADGNNPKSLPICLRQVLSGAETFRFASANHSATPGTFRFASANHSAMPGTFRFASAEHSAVVKTFRFPYPKPSAALGRY